MKTFKLRAGDTMRISANNVVHSDAGPITTGLTATATIINSYTQAVAFNSPMTLHAGNSWYVDVTLVMPGNYVLTVAVGYLLATRSIQARLVVT